MLILIYINLKSINSNFLLLGAGLGIDRNAPLSITIQMSILVLSISIVRYWHSFTRSAVGSTSAPCAIACNSLHEANISRRTRGNESRIAY